MPVYFKIYVDFECILEKVDGDIECSSNSSYTRKYQNHVLRSFAYKVVCVDNKFIKKLFCTEEKMLFMNLLNQFLKKKNICKKYFNKNLILSGKENKKFELASICWICGKLFEISDEKVRDHCHISGKYRGAAHWSCNINLKITKKVSVIFHNLKGYDSHLSRFNVKISVIPNGLENYMAFTVNKNLIFIDSMQFMNSSLHKVVKNLNDKDFKYLSEEFSGEQLKLVKEMAIYPYEYMNSFKRFNEDELPDKSKFFSSLKDSGISEKEYQRADSIWNTFKMNTLGEYQDLYLKTDVLLLADVFEKFVETCLNLYKLDPCNYFSSPGLSWDSMLKITEVELEKISNIDVHNFIEKGMRVGISYISGRYSKVNDSKKKKSIIYWVMNNLHGFGMIQPMPVSNLNFLTKKEINKLDLDSISENSSIGYILEVDLEYCSELHDKRNDYLLCPEKIEISSDMLPKYCSDIANKYGIKVGGVNKLLPNLRDKIKYVVHYKNLQYYLSLGMKLIKVHRILKFKQSSWLKEYIEFNTEKRKKAVSEFEKNLLINCIYGKSIENIRKRISLKLINNSKDYLRCVSKPNFISQKMFDKNFIAVHQIKYVSTLNKPIYVGFSNLELSKLLTYKFHYDYACNKYDAKFLFTDTDSLVYEINSEYIYEQCF